MIPSFPAVQVVIPGCFLVQQKVQSLCVVCFTLSITRVNVLLVVCCIMNRVIRVLEINNFITEDVVVSDYSTTPDRSLHLNLGRLS